jgi:hypothetical protein
MYTNGAVHVRGSGTLAMPDGNCKTGSDDAGLWGRNGGVARME